MPSPPSPPNPGNLLKLNRGLCESRNLAEALSIDFPTLIYSVVPEIQSAWEATILPPKAGIVLRMQTAGRLIAETCDARRVDLLAAHPSDTVRGWICYARACQHANSPINQLIESLLPLADDPHFGVREWAWMALRPRLSEELPAAMERLRPLVNSPSERLRRFAVEATRPRGVWCSHLHPLRREPWLAMTILNPLRDDPSRYVQDSVANWLNDASKDHPEWVREQCQRWLNESSTPAAKRICTRSQRSLLKVSAKTRKH